MSKTCSELTKIDNYYQKLKNNIKNNIKIDEDNFKSIINNNNCNNIINSDIFYLILDEVNYGLLRTNSQNIWIINYFLSLPNFQFNIGNNPEEFDKYFNVYKESFIYENIWRYHNKLSENIIKSGKVNINNYIKYLLSKLNKDIPVTNNYFLKIKFIYQKCLDNDKKIIENILHKNNISCTFINHHNKIKNISKLLIDSSITLIFIISPHYLHTFIILLISIKYPVVSINLLSLIKSIIYLINFIILYVYFYYSNRYYNNFRLLKWFKILYRIQTIYFNKNISHYH